MFKNIKIVNKKKFVRSLSILFIIIMGVIFFSGKTTMSHIEEEKMNYDSIYVNQGDTLWEIAAEQEQNNPYYQGKDVRYVISEIRRINNLNNANLYVGQELKVPVI